MRQISVDYFEEKEEQSIQRGALFTQQQLLAVAFLKIATDLIGKKMVHFTQIQNICGEIRRCYTWSIKKPTLSEMNSTCSMKAWHRCVSLWGPPGRLCTASWFVETGFVFFLNFYCSIKVAGCTHAFCKTIWAPRACWQYFTCVDLKAKGSTAVTLVPIAPPGGKEERSTECSLQAPNRPEVVKPRQGEKPFKWSRCGRRAEALSYPSSVVDLPPW